MTPLLGATGAAIVSGRFVTRWTFVAILALSVTAMSPLPAELNALERAAVAVATAVVFGGAWAVVGLGERRLPAVRGRAALVLAALTVASAVRPLLQDAVSVAAGLPAAPSDGTALRIATNIVVWSVALTGTAVLVDATRTGAETNALLRAVLADLDAGRERARALGGRARRAVDAAVACLLVDRPPTPTSVRELATDVRAHAHALAELAEATAPPAPIPLAVRGPRRRRPLRLPPVGAVAVLYALAVLPYAVRTVSAPDIAAGTLAAMSLGIAGDLLPRSRALRRRPVRARAVFLAGSAATGIGLSALAWAQGVPSIGVSVPAVFYPALALALAGAAGAARARVVERRRLSSAVTARTRAEHLGTRAVRARLRGAAEILHRDAQGAAVLFALQHPRPTPADVTALLRSVAALAEPVRRVTDEGPVSADDGALDRVIATWERVMPVGARIDDDARAVLAGDPALARDVVDVVAEGLLDVAKHARRRAADVEIAIAATGAGPRLTVDVRSPGPAAPDARLRAGSHLHALGARLVIRGDDTVLEASFALRPPPDRPFVAPPEHSDRGEGIPA